MDEKSYLKLIAAMLADIHKQTVKDGDVDSKLVASALWNDSEWAIHWEHGFLLSGQNTPDHVGFVCDVLDMWSFIEVSYGKLDQTDKDRIAAEVPYGYGKNPKFPGFDGNHEGEYITVIRMLTEHMGRFEEFKGRNLNSHAPYVHRYQNMLSVFAPIRESKAFTADVFLSADEIISVLKAS
ncbi:YfbU family protein [Pseudoxanthomonas sp. USHLN014]|uniref:YfbU family protein n=1 Tax=Pseudoxanthomonas sp. USHLN014 TaxID=3081297 RepID=UPI00301B8623